MCDCTSTYNQVKYDRYSSFSDRSIKYEIFNVKNIWFENNGKRFIKGNMNLDWTNDNFVLAYDLFYRFILQSQNLIKPSITTEWFYCNKKLFLYVFERDFYHIRCLGFLKTRDLLNPSMVHSQYKMISLCLIFFCYNVMVSR